MKGNSWSSYSTSNLKGIDGKLMVRLSHTLGDHKHHGQPFVHIESRMP